MLKFKMILEAVDRATGPARRVRAAVADMTKGARKLAQEEDRGAGAARRLAAANARLPGTFARAGAMARRMAGKAGLKSWGDAAEMAGRGTGMLLKKMGGMALTGAKWAAGMATAAASFSIFDMFKKTAEFEQFQAMLDREMGKDRGKQAMAWIKQFATTTPYELDQVTEAFLRLRGAGIDPMDGSLRAAGDAAAGTNKTILDGVEAMNDALTFQFERLREFNITASTQGSRVLFSWVRDGKTFKREVKKDSAEIKAALTDIWNQKYGGAMDVQSRTFLGMISNLRDAWSNFLVDVGQAGIFDFVKSKLQAILDQMGAWARDGTLQRWAQTISDRLKEAWEWAEKFVTGPDGKQFLQDLKDIAAAAKVVADILLSIVENYQKLRFGADMAIGPMGWLKRGKEIYNASQSGGSSRGASPPPTASERFSIPGWSPQVPRSLRAAPRPAPTAPFRGASANTEMRGLVEIKVKADPGTSVRTANVDSSNPRVPLRVDIGRTMAAPA